MHGCRSQADNVQQIFTICLDNFYQSDYHKLFMHKALTFGFALAKAASAYEPLKDLSMRSGILLPRLTCGLLLFLSMAKLAPARSEEHTSELHHLGISYAVFCLKKKKKNYTI